MLVAALAALALGPATPRAAAKQSCARQIIADWGEPDGQINGRYPLHCYNEAIAVVPEDLAVYTGIIEDITAARQQATRRTLQSANPPPPAGASRVGKPDRGLFTQGFDKLGSRNVDTVPLPLLILAGLALLMIGAGAAGLVARHLRSSRAHTPPTA